MRYDGVKTVNYCTRKHNVRLTQQLSVNCTFPTVCKNFCKQSLCHIATKPREDIRGVDRILHWGNRSWALKARESRRRGVTIGEECPPPKGLGGLGSVVRSPRGSGADPRKPTHFWHIWGPQNTFGRENSVTLLNKTGPTPQQTQFFP